MSHFHIDLAFAANSSTIGYSAGQPTPYYPLQFALLLSDHSCFTLGPSGGFAGGDTFDIFVYDISAMSGGTTQPRDSYASLQVAATTVAGAPALDVFSSVPSYQSTTRMSYQYGGPNVALAYSESAQSAAYGTAPCYSISGNPSFTMASPSQPGTFKLSFSFTANGQSYIVDPEMIYGRGGG